MRDRAVARNINLSKLIREAILDRVGRPTIADLQQEKEDAEKILETNQAQLGDLARRGILTRDQELATLENLKDMEETDLNEVEHQRDIEALYVVFENFADGLITRGMIDTDTGCGQWDLREWITWLNTRKIRWSTLVKVSPRELWSTLWRRYLHDHESK
jgi:hypothetical protein